MLSKHTGLHVDLVPIKRAMKAYLNSTDPAFADVTYVGKHRCQLVEELLYTLDRQAEASLSHRARAKRELAM
jgi:hypothetical protein